MKTLLLLAALAVPPGVPQVEPSPTYHDLARFPPPAVVEQARRAVQRHREQMKAFAPLVLASTQEAWWDEGAALDRAASAWESLADAQERWATGDSESCTGSLLILRERLGRWAYACGQMPSP